MEGAGWVFISLEAMNGAHWVNHQSGSKEGGWLGLHRSGNDEGGWLGHSSPSRMSTKYKCISEFDKLIRGGFVGVWKVYSIRYATAWGASMYGAGAIVWKRAEAKSLEVMQMLENFSKTVSRKLFTETVFASFLIQTMFTYQLYEYMSSVWNAVVQGEFGWSTFEEREVKAKMALVRKILWGGSLVAEVGRVLAQATNKWWNSHVIKGLKYYDLT
ncbi:hypothetical protein CAPTEDRAFT_192141 [Capitella teleta]|uniref:Uncharacterized protein n=1 Tax=Capitella teleta TaxID=283909 RepID=R7VFG7_CAPTE|nr:hypothetical protein CAPTEDRAFT_192141 [Capitella teleta]|eukprot:ELU15046.1 hypothetical protein CAPTEDRAFT_192141 [Capitella teleta]